MQARVGVSSCSTEPFRDAVLPLVEAGLVEALERQIDHDFLGGFDDLPQPAWEHALDDLFAANDALYGHAVWFSPLSAGWQARQDAWLERFAAECARLPHRLVSEHFGYFSVGPYQRSTILAPPLCEAAVALAVERWRQLSRAAGGPVGIENTGVALTGRDATDQATFVEEVVHGAGSWLLLDVHNVWVQATNLRLDPRALVDAMPLDHVREVHVAGGRYTPVHGGRPVYMDTHDGPVPQQAKDLLAYALPQCPNLEVVIFERRDGTWDGPGSVEEYRADYVDIHRIVTEAR